MADLAYLVDTTILIDFLRGNQAANAWLKHFAEDELALSVVTAAELVAGCRNRREQKQVEKELEQYPLILVSGAISASAWNWYRQYRLRDGVGFLDCLIGASAYHLGIPVCTLNDKHFRSLPGVKIERPY